MHRMCLGKCFASKHMIYSVGISAQDVRVFRDAAMVTRHQRRKSTRHEAVDDSLAVNVHTADPSYAILPQVTANETSSAHRQPLSRSKAVVSLVRSIGHRKTGRDGVLAVAGLPVRTHPGKSVQSLLYTNMLNTRL